MTLAVDFMERPPQNPPAPPRADHINIFLKVLLLTMVLIPAAICWVAFFGKLYGAIGFAAFLLFMIFMMWLRKRRNITEAEMLRRIDEAMGKPSDDPRQMARWMR